VACEAYRAARTGAREADPGLRLVAVGLLADPFLAPSSAGTHRAAGVALKTIAGERDGRVAVVRTLAPAIRQDGWLAHLFTGARCWPRSPNESATTPTAGWPPPPLPEATPGEHLDGLPPDGAVAVALLASEIRDREFSDEFRELERYVKLGAE
jgi:hypothetical protein